MYLSIIIYKIKQIKNLNKKIVMNIYLDIDDVVADWVPTFCKRYDCPIPTTWVNEYITLDRLNSLKDNKPFWVNLPVRHKPDFTPKGYLSARSVPKQWSYEFMKKNDIPGRSNIYHVPWNVSKIDKLQELKCDIFIDDKAETFIECLNNDIFCLLMDAPHNQHIITEHRIYDLKYNNIVYLWQKLK